MMRALFIAGTDTGIGKTHTACTLIHALRATGLNVCGMKPVASGCIETAQGLRNEDARTKRSIPSPCANRCHRTWRPLTKV
jgi:dethiobiotin synthetase